MWRDPGKLLLVIGFTLTILSTLVVAIRLHIRHVQMHNAGLSDYTMLVALISTWINTVLNYYQTKFGKDARLSQVEKDPTSPKVQAAVSGTLVTWFIYRATYVFCLSLVKLSILIFYRTLVPPSTSFRSFRLFRYTVYTLIAFIILYTLFAMAASIFQCTPISAAYSVSASYSQLPKNRASPKPHCYKPTNIWVFSAIFNFATDAIILILPVPIILSLPSMPLRKRVGLLCILSLGMLTIAAGAVRMWILVLWAKDVRSQSKYGTELLMWGQVEVNCGIIGASAPFLRAVFRECFKRRASKLERMDMRTHVVEKMEAKGLEVSFAASEKIIGWVDVVEEGK
ncbi:hypothetical protein P154DRAFT_502153 [Amniculicola lignicola CBS 123094]|uniref:Rhodopsin domain-containing protein n=1 Tax=Amniculicola lignicola CBS 123094 TaxID=1392246 RepID=A0A6A5W018_9PLEO|nr:hypothetical protein P154DRAFT_502153 [Amniculicola lignicola CBS 123094]